MSHILSRSDCTNTIISLELDEDGNRIVHFMGYGYYSDVDDLRPYRFLEYTFFYESLVECLKDGLLSYESKNSENIKQYTQDYTEGELIDIFRHYDNGNAPVKIRENELIAAEPGIYEIIEK